MRKWIEYFWLLVMGGLLVFFATSYNILPLRSKLAVGAGLFVSTMMYSYRNTLRKRQERHEKEQQNRPDSEQ
jgi:hypothetical protein